uniref:Uncharacterized protein n=2 Tax=Nymphaea colorata TaxID=210225 RepID=A0A5K0VGX8_9MAGN
MQMTPECGHRSESIPTSRRLKSRFAEVAGGTAAECAAVVCCCPCGLASLVVLTMVRLPAGLCRRALRRRKKRGVAGKKRPGLLHERKRDESAPPQVHPAPSESESDGECPDVPTATDDEWQMDEEMLGKLYAGFWRSPSERE